MAPSPQETGAGVPPGPSAPRTGDEVVISGISGLFPSSDDAKQFADNLFNKVDMITTCEYDTKYPDSPKYLGKINGITKFDAQFFKIAHKYSFSLDPMNKKLLEQAYSAIYDSGINPLDDIKGVVGVFTGSSFSDTSTYMMYNKHRDLGNALFGCAKAMFANRISFWINATGPSYNVDCSNTSSMLAFQQAYDAISSGACDAAVVGGSNLCLESNLGIQLRNAGLLSLDGKTKCFDKNSDGQVRAEAVTCVFLQKAKDAKRIYAEVCLVQTKFDLKDGDPFLPLRHSVQLELFLNEFYSATNVSPEEVEYVEANGAAIAEADAHELQAIANIFAKDGTVKVGSVKSNMGNSLSASGLCALTKVALAYHRGTLPGNLHYSDPLDIPALKNGKVEVVQKNTPFKRTGYTAVNNFDFLGTSCHALLKGRFKPKDTSKYESSIPRLVLISGRHDAAIKKIIDFMQNHPFDPEIIGMFQNIYKIATPGHTCRGYVIVDKNENNETLKLAENTEHFTGIQRPLWLVYSGMGSQWPGMAADLMKIPIFANAIHKCQKALEPYGVDLIKIITEPDKTIFDKILNCFIGISAVQIGLTDILKAVGIVPNYVIGHSQGEMGCAYFDDCFSAEEMIRGAYSRGLVSTETKFIKGAMAAVGLGYKDILPLLPEEIDVACHNSNESATLSGPYDELHKFVAELTAKGIFAREVPSTNIAFHSRYISHAGPAFLERMAEIIKVPKPRSSKWVSTSVPRDQWDQPLAQYSSPEYHANNMLNAVLFEEAASLIPSDAVVVEVAPHGLLQAILKRSHPDCIHIPLTRRNHPNPVQFLLEALGKIYEVGNTLDIAALYPQIEYPVSTETQMLSHLVEWEHSFEWIPVVRMKQENTVAAIRKVLISDHDDEYKYLSGYIRNGINVLPEAAILQLVWETLAMSKGVSYKTVSVFFKYVEFHGEIVMKTNKSVKVTIMISKGNDYFEVTFRGALIVSGYIVQIAKNKFGNLEDDEVREENETYLNSDDVYKCLYAKGLSLKGEFQTIEKTNLDITEAVVKCKDNWVIFLDSLLQLQFLANDSEDVSKPAVIERIVIDIDEHNKVKQQQLEEDNKTYFKARLYKIYKVLRCGGVEIRDSAFQVLTNNEQQPDVLDTMTFIPHLITGDLNMDTALLLNLQLVADNIVNKEIRISEIINASTPSLLDAIRSVADNVPNLNLSIQSSDIQKVNKAIGNADLIVIQDLVANGTAAYNILNEVSKDTFILAFGQNIFINDNFTVIASVNVQRKEMKLLKKTNFETNNISCIPVHDEDNFSWIPKVQSELQKTKRVVLVSERQPQCGLFGFVKKLSKKFNNKISLVIIDDYHASTFDINRHVYKEQIAKNLIFNVFQKGHWGSYYYLPISGFNNIQNFKLVNTVCGDFDSLKWVETPAILQTNNLVQVCYSGISQRDSLKVLGLVENGKQYLGMDFSGFDSNGDRVMGLVKDSALASTVQADPDLLWPIPKHWTLEEAATVPLPFVHACYFMAIRYQVRRGHSVFVNGGCGALGQAVISLSLSLNCQVFTSVSDIDKKRYLLKLFPQLKVANVACSQMGAFHDMVLINTKGKRCDFVVNCASGESREAAMRCVGNLGIFLDVGTYDFNQNKSFGMSYLQGERSYVRVNMSSIFEPQNVKEKKMLQSIIAEGIRNGSVRPLTGVVYPTTEISRAFRLISTNKHRGRVIIKIKNAEISAQTLNVIPRAPYSVNGSYVIVCDEGVLGAELANRLIHRGVKKLVLNLKSKTVSGYLHTKFRNWMKLGAQIKLSFENLDSDRKCLQLLKDAEKMGRVQGLYIIHELSTQDSWMQEDFIAKYDKAIASVSNFDVLSRNNCPELRAFAILSRATSNVIDEYATSVFDRICSERQAIGLPAISFKIQCLNDLHFDHSTQERLQPQNIVTVLNALETSLKQKQASSVTTYNLKRTRSSEFLGKVSKTLGVSSIDELDQDLQVNDLIPNDVRLEELRLLIKNTLQLEVSIKNVMEMSVASLKALSQNDRNNKFNQGLGEFYTFVNNDEYSATDIMAYMNTLCGKNKMIDQLDGSATHMMLIPGFDGQYNTLKTLCKRLKVEAMTFQLGPDVVEESIPEMAARVLKYIKKTFILGSKFYLLGYSFGVIVALEVAYLLENEGYKGTVYCLDSSPEALKVQLEARIGSPTDNELQNLIIRHFVNLMTGDENINLDDIEKLNNWSEKVDITINKLRNMVTYSTLYLRNVFDSAYNRIRAANNYFPDLKLESEIVLIKGKPHRNSKSLAADYGLSKYTNKPVKVFDIESDHATAPEDCRVPNIVNKHLAPELIEHYQNLNTCISYFKK